jgi:TolB protein
MRASWVLILVLLSLNLPGTIVLAQEGGQIPPTLPGRIAYISTDYNVYSLHPATNNRVQLTEDGDRAQPYIWPTWSTDGRLAYFLSVTTTREIATEIYVSDDGNSAGNLLYDGDGTRFNYAYWSPQNCNEGERCRDLAVLLSSAEGLGVQLIRDSDEGTRNQLIGRGGPFYYSWSPDGNRMLWQRNNQRMDIFDVINNDIIDTLPQQPGAFLAPAWSPIDDRLLFGVLAEDSGTTDLVIAANDEISTLASSLEGIIYFEWSPDGNRVAYTSARGPLMILDAITGETISQTTTSGVLSFFWSPDSDHVAYITLASPPGSINAKTATERERAIYQETPEISWSVLDVETGQTRRSGTFTPTEEMLYLLVYFDQFSQSHRLWSPDSRYLLYSEITPDNRTSINVLDTTQTNVVPLSIADGFIGIWSFS